MQHINLQTLLRYADKWVALTVDQKRIVESGETVEELEKKLTAKKIKDAIISFIPPADKSISP